jgi:hypothetical protein
MRKDNLREKRQGCKLWFFNLFEFFDQTGSTWAFPGGRGSSERGNIRGYNVAINALNNSDCAKALGAKSSQGAINFLSSVPIKDASLKTQISVVERGNNAYDIVYDILWGAAPNGTIQLNQNIPNVTHFLAGKAYGQDVYANFSQDWESQFDLRSGTVDSSTFWAFTLLHELGHLLGGLANDSNSKELSFQNYQKVINNCFKNLKAE